MTMQNDRSNTQGSRDDMNKNRPMEGRPSSDKGQQPQRPTTGKEQGSQWDKQGSKTQGSQPGKGSSYDKK